MGLPTSDLNKECTGLFQPTGEDAEILAGRNDTKFSQKVRNLVAHYTLEKRGYVTYDRSSRNNLHEITQQGQQCLTENLEVIEYLLSNNFAYDDIRSSFDNVSELTERKRKILTYDENLMITEGIRKNRNVSLYERSRQLREIAIQHYMVNGHIKCFACTFDFYDFYGEIGKSYIEIHHLKPVFQYEDEDIKVFWRRALQNLIPACSNCHRMIHRNRQNPLSVEQIKNYINSNGRFVR